jgi:ribosome recycling factor
VKTNEGTFSLNELGTISQKSTGVLVVNMSSLPNFIPDVMKTISESSLNVNPQQEGTTIFLPLPKVTKVIMMMMLFLSAATFSCSRL